MRYVGARGSSFPAIIQWALLSMCLEMRGNFIEGRGSRFGKRCREGSLSCYWLLTERKSWRDAVDFCTINGGVLSDLATWEELQFFRSLLLAFSATAVWVNASGISVSTNDAKYNCTGEEETRPSLTLCCTYSAYPEETTGTFVSCRCDEARAFACKYPIYVHAREWEENGGSLKRRQLPSQPGMRLNEAEREIGPEVRKKRSVNDGNTTSEETPLLAFRVIGCSTLTITVGLTVIIYVTTGMFYLDCLAQICSELGLLAAYVCIFLTTADSYRLGPVICTTTAILLHYFYLTVFLFLLLEVVIMCSYLVRSFPKGVFTRPLYILLMGWGLPAFITSTSAAVMYDQYTNRTENCWLNLSGGPVWPTIIPVGLFVGLHVLLLIVVLFIEEVPPSLSPEDFTRAKTFLSTRWASGIIIIAASVSWATGVMASHRGEESFYVVFVISSIFFGVFILILRISTDDQVRKRILSALVRSPHSTNKVFAWSSKSIYKGTMDHIDIPSRESSWSSSRQIVTPHR